MKGFKLKKKFGKSDFRTKKGILWRKPPEGSRDLTPQKPEKTPTHGRQEDKQRNLTKSLVLANSDQPLTERQFF